MLVHTDDIERTHAGDSTEKDLPSVVVTDATNRLEGKPHSFARRLVMFRQMWTTLPQFFVSIYRPILLLRYPGVFWWVET